MFMNYYDELINYARTIPVIDAHEHISIYDGEKESGIDILKEVFAFYYLSTDLIMSGMSQAALEYVRDVTQSVLKRWDVLEPYWRLNAHTGYARIIKIFAKDLYGIDHIDRNSIEQLNKAYCEANKPGHLHEILKKCNIEYCVIQHNRAASIDQADRTYYRGSYRVDSFIFPELDEYMEVKERTEVRKMMRQAADKANITLDSLEKWTKVCEYSVATALNKGEICLKSTAAYMRSLLFEEPDEEEAAKYFDRLWQEDASDEISVRERTAFEDYMMHFILRLANDRGLIFQFHTGLLGGDGEGHILQNSDPSLMCNIIKKYTNVKFDLLHMGYPYEHAVTAMLKMHPNVYVNMAWAQIISPEAYRNILSEWLESVAINKIMAFGGDHEYVDHIYGSLVLAKMHVCKVLAQKIQDGVFNLEEAKWAAKRLFYDNPKELYGE